MSRLHKLKVTGKLPVKNVENGPKPGVCECGGMLVCVGPGQFLFSGCGKEQDKSG